MIQTAAGTFVYDLEAGLTIFFHVGNVGIFTIAVMEFPTGPVTEMQAPQFPESAQFESESAVPNIPLGRVYVENEQAPPWRLPP
jgi:hypothetical protein